jgi:hypothetical protein
VVAQMMGSMPLPICRSAAGVIAGI